MTSSSMRGIRLVLQIVLPLAILGGGAFLAMFIMSKKATPRVETDVFLGPVVATHIATTEDVRIDVEAQGVVEPHRSIDLAPQVGGRVTAISPALRAGGFFAVDDILLQIDRSDYELAIVQQQAAVARAELRVLQEKAESDAAIRAWKKLEGDRPADDLVTRKPQIVDAEQSLAAAKALLARSKLDLARTSVRAPFAGRVRSAKVDVGQIVQPGVPLGQLYGIDRAEVRLPLPVSAAAFLDLPLHWSNASSATVGPRVDLFAEFGGSRHAYQGVVLRTEGEIDRKTRQLKVVVGVEAPYARSEQQDRPPLAVGTFVQATIHGRVFPATIVLPRAALRGEDEVWVVDAEHRLRRHQVEVLRIMPDRVYISSGLQAGDVVSITALDVPVDGMPVRLVAEQGQ